MPNVNVFLTHRPQQVHVKAFSQQWLLVGETAYDWLGCIGADLAGLTGVFPGMVEETQLEMLYEYILEDDFHDRCIRTARVAIGRAAGKDWWWALNLCKQILPGWSLINGIMLREGISSQHIGFADYLDAVYSLLWERSDKEGRMKLDVELSMMPAGVRVKQNSAARKRMLDDFAAD